MPHKIGTTLVFRGAKIRSKWISRYERTIWCCDFSDWRTDHHGLLAEIEASDAVIRQQRGNSLLIAVDLYQTKLGSELEAFFRVHAARTPNPIRKMAIVYVSDVHRLLYRLVKRITWPRVTKFFDDYETAKDWLVAETF